MVLCIWAASLWKPHGRLSASLILMALLICMKQHANITARELYLPALITLSGFMSRHSELMQMLPVRPDSLYGVSKVFGEAMARMYYDKFGIETAIVRIGSCFPEPVDHRMLSTWMSYDDFMMLIATFNAPRLGCPIIYGASANAASWWDNSKTDYIGWNPKDSSEVFRAKIRCSDEPT